MRLTKCQECRGTGVAEYIGGWPRPCEGCNGEGEFNMSKRIREAKAKAA